MDECFDPNSMSWIMATNRGPLDGLDQRSILLSWIIVRKFLGDGKKKLTTKLFDSWQDIVSF